MALAAQGPDHGAINAAVEALAHGTEAFAALRMNRSIQQALSKCIYVQKMFWHDPSWRAMHACFRQAFKRLNSWVRFAMCM